MKRVMCKKKFTRDGKIEWKVIKIEFPSLNKTDDVHWYKNVNDANQSNSV